MNENMKKIVYRKSVDLNKYPLINKFSDPLMKSNVVRASRNTVFRIQNNNECILYSVFHLEKEKLDKYSYDMLYS